MTWDSSKAANKILTIGEMNQSKSYNIFPNVTSSSADWNRCPTEDELSRTSVVYNGYTYKVQIDSKDYDKYQLVPNSVLTPKATSNSWSLYVSAYFTIQDYTILAQDVRNNPDWTCIEGSPNGSSDAIWQTLCDIQFDIYTSTGAIYRTETTIATVQGDLLYRYSSLTGVNGTGSTILISGIPTSTRITNIEVQVSNGFEGYKSQSCNYSSSTNGASLNIDMGQITYTGGDIK